MVWKYKTEKYKNRAYKKLYGIRALRIKHNHYSNEPTYKNFPSIHLMANEFMIVLASPFTWLYSTSNEELRAFFKWYIQGPPFKVMHLTAVITAVPGSGIFGSTKPSYQAHVQHYLLLNTKFLARPGLTPLE